MTNRGSSARRALPGCRIACAIYVIVGSLVFAGGSSLRSFGGAASPKGEPQIVEFGPTFRSPLGDLLIGPDDAIWAAESDGVARMTRDGRVTQIRRSDDAHYVEGNGIGIGPARSVWTNGADRLLRFTGDGVRDFKRTVTNDYLWRISAFAATPYGIFTSCEAERGVRLTLPGRPDRRLFAEIGHVDAMVSVRGDALWLIAYPTRAGGVSLTFASRTAIRQRDVARAFASTHRFVGPYAAAADGGFLAGVSGVDKPGERTESMAIVHVRADGSVREIARWPGNAFQLNVGSIAAGNDGDVWLSEPNANRIVRVDSAGTRREYRELPRGAEPTGIAVDRDGSVWYSDGARSSIGHLWPADGHVRVFGNALAPNGSPGPPVIAGDGAAWFRETLAWHPRITRLGRDGSVREFVDPFPQDCFIERGSGCSALHPAGSGVLFTNASRYAMFGSRDPRPRALLLAADGALREVSLDGCLKSETNFACLATLRGHGVLKYPFASSNDSSIAPNSVVVGPDGNLWFTDRDRSAIGRVTPDGRFTFFTRGLTRWNSGPQYIAVGPDGALWFTEIRDRVGRITTHGRITEYSAGIPFRSSIGGIVTGPDKNLWFTLYHGNELVRMTPAGAITRFRRGIYPSRGFDEWTDSVPFVDRSGNIWFNEPQGGRIARATIR